jgi:hypothetical protein
LITLNLDRKSESIDEIGGLGLGVLTVITRVIVEGMIDVIREVIDIVEIIASIVNIIGVIENIVIIIGIIWGIIDIVGIIAGIIVVLGFATNWMW